MSDGPGRDERRNKGGVKFSPAVVAVIFALTLGALVGVYGTAFIREYRAGGPGGGHRAAGGSKAGVEAPDPGGPGGAEEEPELRELRELNSRTEHGAGDQPPGDGR